MPRPRKARLKEPMSREALEALSVSVLRRVDGLEDLMRVGIDLIDRDENGHNWDVSLSVSKAALATLARGCSRAVAGSL
jgi:hypothetical protein